jgi:hypothetical protein
VDDFCGIHDLPYSYHAFPGISKLVAEEGNDKMINAAWYASRLLINTRKLEMQIR